MTSTLLNGVVVGSVDEGALYFGPAENMAGLERPVAVLAGFRHPRHLLARGVDASRVDPVVYIAATRTTFLLVPVEVHPEHFVRHWCIEGDEAAYWKEYANEGDGETMRNDNRE